VRFLPGRQEGRKCCANFLGAWATGLSASRRKGYEVQTLCSPQSSICALRAIAVIMLNNRRPEPQLIHCANQALVRPGTDLGFKYFGLL